MRRSLNHELLSKEIDKRGYGAIKELSRTSLIGQSTISMMKAGDYKSEVSAKTRKNLCEALGIHEDLLFPPLKGGRIRAS